MVNQQDSPSIDKGSNILNQSHNYDRKVQVSQTSNETDYVTDEKFIDNRSLKEKSKELKHYFSVNFVQFAIVFDSLFHFHFFFFF